MTKQPIKKSVPKDGNDDEQSDPIMKKIKDHEKKESKVTLSGLRNCIDGLLPSCGGERLIVFTTNYVEKLDPALIRRGRMDKHIELSYCCFDAFKVFAKNYLEIESHSLFAEIETLLGETKMTPSDVAEKLMSKLDYDVVETCLKRLIEALKEAKKKAEDEDGLMAEKEEEKQRPKSGKEGTDQCVKEVRENGVAEEVKENGVSDSH